jgi:ribosomal protein S18 acetylase RimI-like enzyme
MDRDKIIKIKPSIEKVRFFFENNKSKYFRYYEKRPFDIIEEHVYTSLYLYDGEIIGYGHIDRENSKNWLGIFISDKYRGKGIGKIIMMDLIENSEDDIYLTVDRENIGAINLYKKFGFIIDIEENNYHLMLYKK